MPATFATFAETFPATLAESHARRSSRRRPPRPPRRSRGQPPAWPQGDENGGKLAAQAASHEAGYNATPQDHKQGPQNKRDGGGIEIATNIKTPYTRVKTANKANSRKAPGIHREQKKNPAQREPCGARLFLELCKVKKQQHGLQQDIQQDQVRHLLAQISSPYIFKSQDKKLSEGLKR